MIVELEDHEIATLRVALINFSEHLNDEGLGDDEHGKEMVRIYQININSILKKILNQ
ncbi:hypothetical protein [Phytobacter diazotrophicus]|jgi:hypothetical protein|uniref:hypothetical protein n=1 Tax=Phytobacter diazotrophicus TaxID=395631 RepID=UPI0029368949|nr:hypothetical protein [Phytobacter diazotrophicus]MDV2874473.1 hypothetical protein [Phytobacter diazotrophicus]